LGYEDFSKEDRLVPSDYNFEERVLILGIGQILNKFSLQTYIQGGKREDKLTGSQNEPIERYTVLASFSPGQGQTYSLFAQTGHDRYSPTFQRTNTAGVSASWRINNTLNFFVNYQMNNINLDNKREQHNLFSTLVYTLPNNHFLSFKYRWLEFKDTKAQENAFFVAYSIPLGIPVSKKKGLGVLKGRIYDGEKTDGSPIANVILTANGVTAVTDKKGEFIFPGLKPGTYSLRLEQNTIGLQRVTSEKFPLVVEIKEEKTNYIDVAVVNSCNVSGEVVVSGARENEKDGSKKIKRLGDVLVEIRTDKEVLREQTDNSGKFSFKGIRPGTWNLKFYPNNLPVNHSFDKEEFQLDLKPGEEKVVAGNVAPRSKQIQMIDEGEIKKEMKMSKKED
jgi:hypothetical protein